SGERTRPFLSTARSSRRLCARIAPSASPIGTSPNLIYSTLQPLSRRKPGPTCQPLRWRRRGSRLSPGKRLEECGTARAASSRFPRRLVLCLAQHLGHLAKDRHGNLGLRHGADREADRAMDAGELGVAEAKFLETTNAGCMR